MVPGAESCQGGYEVCGSMHDYEVGDYTYMPPPPPLPRNPGRIWMALVVVVAIVAYGGVLIYRFNKGVQKGQQRRIMEDVAQARAEVEQTRREKQLRSVAPQRRQVSSGPWGGRPSPSPSPKVDPDSGRSAQVVKAHGDGPGGFHPSQADRDAAEAAWMWQQHNVLRNETAYVGAVTGNSPLYNRLAGGLSQMPTAGMNFQARLAYVARVLIGAGCQVKYEKGVFTLVPPPNVAKELNGKQAKEVAVIVFKTVGELRLQVKVQSSTTGGELASAGKDDVK